MKPFDLWNTYKKHLDSLTNFRHPKEREIWWCMLGVNVGTEIYGKGARFTRPVLVVNTGIGQGCVVIPLSSKIKNKKYTCIIKTDDEQLHAALVSQVRNVDKKRFTTKITILSCAEYLRVKKVFDDLYKV